MTTEHELKPDENQEPETEEEVLSSRRDFLFSLGRWSKAVIAGTLLGGSLLNPRRDAIAGTAWGNGGHRWANGGGGWGNHGGSWANRSGGWANHGGGWANHGGGWANHGGSWANGGRGWVNRPGGTGWSNHGRSWANHGGGSWSNR